MKRCALLPIALLAVGLHGCASSGERSPSPYEPQTSSSRSSAESEKLAKQAARIIDDSPESAEKLLREALGLDLYNGPAHNNLGVLFLRQGKLYEAAGEFEWARKLMPGHPDPRLNLALTWEAAGRTEDALATYDTALEVYPDHLPTVQAIARLQIRSGKTDDRTPGLLRDIALRGQDEQWRAWAVSYLTKLEGR